MPDLIRLAVAAAATPDWLPWTLAAGVAVLLGAAVWQPASLCGNRCRDSAHVAPHRGGDPR
jgi:hypothetical protein